MSKVGKKPIPIPENVNVEISERVIKIKGPLKEEIFEIPQNFRVYKEDNFLKIEPIEDKDNRRTKALWGTYRALLNNKIIGVSQGFQVDLILEGLGYSIEARGKELVCKLGFSHPVKIEIPDDIQVEIKQAKGQYIVSVKGTDKEKVGQFAAKIRSLKPRDAYKLKGFRYVDELVKPKPIKKSLGK
jgi:large subunit ribosomal protein L6